MVLDTEHSTKIYDCLESHTNYCYGHFCVCIH